MKGEDTVNRKGKNQITNCGELALKVSVDLFYTITLCNFVVPMSSGW